MFSFTCSFKGKSSTMLDVYYAAILYITVAVSVFSNQLCHGNTSVLWSASHMQTWASSPSMFLSLEIYKVVYDWFYLTHFPLVKKLRLETHLFLHYVENQDLVFVHLCFLRFWRDSVMLLPVWTWVRLFSVSRSFCNKVTQCQTHQNVK